MPIFRGRDGKLIDSDSDAGKEVTRRVSRPQRGSKKGTSEGPDTKTRIIGPRQPSSGRDSTAVTESMDDPVVGWLVVIAGPGRGRSFELGYGMNSVGRSSTERVRLDFGDQQISRSCHASITFDPLSRKYFIAHGGGRNLTYLNREPILAPIELKGGEEIIVGDTTIRFVPLCDDEFDWGA